MTEHITADMILARAGITGAARGEQPPEAPSAPPRLTIADRALTRSELRKLPQPEPLIADTIERRSVVIVVGPYGTGKTFLTLDWGLSVATGLPWMGRNVVTPGPVLYVASEGAYGFDARVTAWEQHNRRDVADDEFMVVPFPVNLRDRQAVAEVAAMADGRALVVFDTLARCLVGADENSNRDMGEAIDNLYAIREATNGGTVGAVHHTGKDGVTTRGASALEDGVETVYKANGDARRIKLERTKRKDGPTHDALSLRLEEVGPSCVLVPARSTASGEDDAEWIASARQMALMERISDLLMQRPEGLSQRAIRSLINKARTEDKVDALNLLIHNGYVTDATPHQLVRPFRSPLNRSPVSPSGPNYLGLGGGPTEKPL